MYSLPGKYYHQSFLIWLMWRETEGRWCTSTGANDAAVIAVCQECGGTAVISRNKLALLHFALVNTNKKVTLENTTVLPANDTEPFGWCSVIYGQVLNFPPSLPGSLRVHFLSQPASNADISVCRTWRSLTLTLTLTLTLVPMEERQEGRGTLAPPVQVSFTRRKSNQANGRIAATQQGAGGCLCTCNGEVHAG